MWSAEQFPSALIPNEGEALTRDGELVRFVGRHGAVSVEHVMAALGVGRTAAYRRVAACVECGLLQRLPLLREEPSLLRATRAGLRYAGLGLPVAVISPGAVDHRLRCATAALVLSAELGVDRIVTERELRFAERTEGRPIASAEVGTLPGGAPRLHRPDLVVLEGERATAIEVELSAKAPARLDAIIRAWRRTVAARRIDGVRYLCAPGPARRAVERSVERTHARLVRIEEAPPRHRPGEPIAVVSPPGES